VREAGALVRWQFERSFPEFLLGHPSNCRGIAPTRNRPSVRYPGSYGPLSPHREPYDCGWGRGVSCGSGESWRVRVQVRKRRRSPSSARRRRDAASGGRLNPL
jgi:hypothetical protein